MTVLKQYNTSTSTWDTVVVGQPGEPGIVTASTAPADTSVLWMDTADTASQVAIPSGGTAGQILAKTTGTDYATGWVDDTDNRNLIINGAFEFWQRAANPATVVWKASGDYYADRWSPHQYQSGMMSRTTVAAGSGPSSPYAHRVGSVTTAQEAGGSRMVIGQKVESNNSYPLRGKSVTLSFWIRFSSATFASITNTGGSDYGPFTASIGYSTNTTDAGHGTTGYDSASDFTIANGSLPTGWTKISVTGVAPSNVNNLTVRFGFQSLGSTSTAGANWYEVTDVKLEQSSVATPFNRAGGSFQGELAACQRYYVRFTNPNGDGSGLGHGWAYSSTGAVIDVFFPVTMRVSPSSVDWAGVTASDHIGYTSSVTAITISGKNPDSIFLSITSSSLNTSRLVTLQAGTGIGFSAEL